MMKHIIYLLIGIVAILTACSGQKYAKMQERLHRLNAFNKADSVFRSTDKAQALVDYFDDNGTPNEQMLAYYLLGRAYHDLHEAPMALKYFQIATERADTTDADCDYPQLSRIYGQMSKVFYQQNLMRQSLKYTGFEELFAWKGGDTLTALRGMGGKIAIYKRMNQPDRAIVICEKLCNLLTQYGYKDYSAAYRSSIIRELINRGDLEKAATNFRIYESESGYFDEFHNINSSLKIQYTA